MIDRGSFHAERSTGAGSALALPPRGQRVSQSAEGFDFSVSSHAQRRMVIARTFQFTGKFMTAADYFDPYSTQSLIESLSRTLYAPDAFESQCRLRTLGQEVSADIAEKICRNGTGFWHEL